MAATIHNNVFDAALTVISSNGDEVLILSGAATDYTTATTNKLGAKASPGYDAIADGTSGRKLVLQAISDGSVTATGTASHFAITNGTDTVYVCQELSASQGVTSGNTFTLTACTIQLSDPTA